MRGIACAFGILLVGGLIGFVLVWNGIIQLNHPSQESYPVRGVDVSSYQGEIDWQVLSRQGIQFAFIKATEGSSLCLLYTSFPIPGASRYRAK